MKRTTKSWFCGVLMGVLALTGLGWAQPGGGMGPGGGGRRNFDPEQMRQRMAQRMMEQLGVNEQEWKVIEPLYTKVADLQRQSRGGFRFGMFGRRGNRNAPGGPQADADQTPVQKAQQALSELLQSSNPSPEDIKAKLTALRQAREQARQELAKAQEELRKVLSLKQEAQLVLMGMLD